MTEARRPLHLPVVVGLSAGVYAVSLAGVTALQSSHDRAVLAEHRPAADAVAALRATHDELDARLEHARHTYATAAAGYDALAMALGAFDGRLATVAGQVDAVRTAPLVLPGSGGSAGVSGGRVVIVRSAAAPLPPAPGAPAAAAPVAHTTTGGSAPPP